MGNRNKKYGQSYDLATMAALKGVPLPDKVKCDRCHRYLIQDRYSQNQLDKARYDIMKRGPTARYVAHCRGCAGGQTVEIECIMCHKTKGLEDFAKSQKKKPDSAKCFECVDEQLDREPIEEERYEDPREAFRPLEDSASATEYPDYWAPSTTAGGSEAGDFDDQGSDDGESGGVRLSDNLSKMSVSESIPESLIDSEYASPAVRAHGFGGNYNPSLAPRGGDGWNTVHQTKSWHTKTTTTASASSGWDPTKYGAPGGRSGTPASAHTFNSNLTERSTTSPAKGGFARIKAYKPEKVEKVVDDEWASEEEEEGGADTDGSDIDI
ncbi:Stc1 domain-containing protein [Massariosphaeria phaeospora]|uniref:Stc1 domain-containing protein n=1 Tax=Massariosphaeria phaeospora TaxID=100035 RepID=A0A7C8MMP3_9PLEO|nr:Stc1 domain-containing protein [Massariosphaeria phaeospora]